MTPLVCIGSINADHIYAVPHLPLPGETLAALGLTRMLGGKGANQSIAAALAGGVVRHVGAIGADGVWMRQALQDKGVDVQHVAQVDGPSGHAIIAVDAAGENSILLFAGTNQTLTEAQITDALQGAPGLVVLQNETNLGAFSAKAAQQAGWRLIYSAAPFDVAQLAAIAPFADTVLLNAVEAAQWLQETGRPLADIGAARVIVTRGAQGCSVIEAGAEAQFPAPKVKAVDTTGAGDTFAGVYAQGIAAGLPVCGAVQRAIVAAALQVTRPGTSDAMPTAAEIDSFSA